MKRILFIIFFLTFISASSVSAEQDLSAEIQSIKQQLNVIRSGAIQSNASAAEAISTLQQMQSEFEAVKTSIEKNEHLIRQQNNTVNLRLSDMEARIAAIEEKLAIQGKQVTSAVSAVAPEAAHEAELYQTALNQINNSEFLKAIATFKKFMAKFPKSEYNANAQYWIGECYFAMRDYEQSIKEFQILKEKYPRSDKVPAALLRQGYAFDSLGMESDAKVFFNDLIRKYPHTKEAKEAKEKLAKDQEEKIKAKKSPAEDEVPLAPGVKVPAER